ncbi:PREDICTED: glutaminyl-peptide cyclotransferase-like [Populus euphratica]|uniref:Glutaminyl-peptide cyclotransferase-like n=1 Tax=Populus euphratica TaxID=75702 RepID=A0AAJ6USK5_POPEU|nr:PREDICTED: glutaminyl-peptide cyclotransferase-like [Populus euphratica]
MFAHNCPTQHPGCALAGISSNIMSGVASLPKLHAVQVINEFTHDPSAFTEGLLYAGNGTLYESTGLYGNVEVLQKMDDSYFGEGLTLFEQRLFQLVYLTKTGFIYGRNTSCKSLENKLSEIMDMKYTISMN